MTKVGLSAIGTSTPLESNKSLAAIHAIEGHHPKVLVLLGRQRLTHDVIIERQAPQRSEQRRTLVQEERPLGNVTPRIQPQDHQKRREAPAFMPGMDRRWARRAQCPRAQQDLRSTRALNGRGHCIGGSPGIHAGEDVPSNVPSGSVTVAISPC